MIRVAIIGFGNRGSQYADLLRKSGRADIAAADRYHFAEASAALKTGYDVLIEKPVACTEADCRALAALAA